MPELRIDPLSGLRVIVAGERGTRPGAWLDVPQRPPIDPESDPFAEGHEDQTPPEVYALREGSARRLPGLAGARGAQPLPGAAGPASRTRCADPLAGGRGEPDLFASRPARGAHELIVNSPRPVWSLAELEAEEVETAMFAWRERMWEHQQASYVHVIVNEGREAGASLPHTHAQLYALPFVPVGDRARARALHRLLGPHAGPQPARRPAAGGGQARRAGRRHRRRGGGPLPVRRARALPPADRAAPAGGEVPRGRPARAPACCTRRSRRLGSRAGRAAAAQPLGAHRARATPSASAGGST